MDSLQQRKITRLYTKVAKWCIDNEKKLLHRGNIKRALKEVTHQSPTKKQVEYLYLTVRENMIVRNAMGLMNAWKSLRDE